MFVAAATSTDRLHGDEDFQEYSRAEEARIERRAGALTVEKLADPAWWNDRLEGVNASTADLPSQIARCMGNLHHARRGEPIALDAITTALSQLERTARQDAMAEAQAEAVREFEAGEL